MEKPTRTDYKYIYFGLSRNLPKTAVYIVYSKTSNAPLAEVKWMPAWRQYSVFFLVGTIFNKGCLLDIIDFLDQLNEIQKMKPGRKPKEKKATEILGGNMGL